MESQIELEIENKAKEKKLYQQFNQRDILKYIKLLMSMKEWTDSQKTENTRDS